MTLCEAGLCVRLRAPRGKVFTKLGDKIQWMINHAPTYTVSVLSVTEPKAEWAKGRGKGDIKATSEFKTVNIDYANANYRNTMCRFFTSFLDILECLRIQQMENQMEVNGVITVLHNPNQRSIRSFGEGLPMTSSAVNGALAVLERSIRSFGEGLPMTSSAVNGALAKTSCRSFIHSIAIRCSSS